MLKSILLMAISTGVAANVLISCENSNPKPVGVQTTQSASNDDVVKRGEYLVTSMGCDDCHSPKIMGTKGPELDMEHRFAGYLAERPLPKVDENAVKNGWVLFVGDLTATVGPWGVSFAANISSDVTGIGNWGEEQFKKAMKEGKYKGLDSTRMLLPPMPWQNFRNLKDEDLNAIFAFLQSTKPINNVVPQAKKLEALSEL